MRRSDTAGRLWLLLVAAVAVCGVAHAYIDPGTASAVWALGLAPVVGFLGWMGRKIVRTILRRGDDEEDDTGSDQDEAESAEEKHEQ